MIRLLATRISHAKLLSVTNFTYYFPDISAAARQQNLDSIAIGEAIQEEDAAICRSVQRGLNSRAFTAGRLSVRREGGEHLFHRLLAVDLRSLFAGEGR
jgi:choline monooxygenase